MSKIPVLSKQEELAAKEDMRIRVAGIRDDPFSFEFARRLYIAEMHMRMGISFRSLYQRYKDAFKSLGKTVEVPTILAMIVLEDIKFGEGYPNTIALHPIVEFNPELQNIKQSRLDERVVDYARNYEAAYATMQKFTPEKPTVGVSSFERELAKIDEQDDRWIVLGQITVARIFISGPQRLSPQ